MTVKKRISRIVGLTADIVKTAETALNAHEPAPASITDEIKRLWGRDYGYALRSGLSRAEVREIVRAAKRTAWPHLNDEAVRLGSMKEFAQRASALGADFRIAKMPWPSGLAVFGFYLGKDSGLEKRPLICLNGAHHPAAVATAFLHEVGHHVTAELVFHAQRIGPDVTTNGIRGASERPARAGRRRAREPRCIPPQHCLETVRERAGSENPER